MHAYKEFRPVPDQAVSFKIELRDLLVPVKLAKDDEGRFELHKLVSREDMQSQLVADVSSWMGDTSRGSGKKTCDVKFVHQPETLMCHKSVDTGENNDRHCDLKLLCRGETIFCHKFMLSARSPVLRMILSGDSKEAQTGVIEIGDSHPATIRQFVKFLYSEEIDKHCTVDSLALLLHLADKYNVETLTRICCQRLQSEMHKDNASDIIRLARMYKLDIEETAKEYVAEKAKDVIKTDAWKDLLHSDPDVANDIIIRLLK